MNFKRNFDQHYGVVHPTFYQGTYSQVCLKTFQHYAVVHYSTNLDVLGSSPARVIFIHTKSYYYSVCARNVRAVSYASKNVVDARGLLNSLKKGMFYCWRYPETIK